MRSALIIILPCSLAACAVGRSSPFDLPLDAPPAPDRPLALDKVAELGVPDRPAPDRLEPDRLEPDRPRPDLLAPDRRPPDRPPLDTGPRLLFSYDFEANSGGLVPSLDWQWGQLAFKEGYNCGYGVYPPASCHSGTRCWGTVLNDCYNPLGNNADACANKNTADDSILSLSFQIPGDYHSAKLVYWEWTDINTPYDWAEVRANGQPVLQYCPGGYTAPTAWVKRTIDLAAYIGKPLTIGFHFMASSTVNLAGWYLDDVSLGE